MVLFNCKALCIAGKKRIGFFYIHKTFTIFALLVSDQLCAVQYAKHLMSMANPEYRLGEGSDPLIIRKMLRDDIISFWRGTYDQSAITF